MKALAVFIALIGASTPAAVSGAAAARPVGDARIIAEVPNPPGFPEGIAVRGERFYVAGPATFGTTSKAASKVLAYRRPGGPPVGTYDAKGEDLLQEHANSSIAFDAAGRLYVLNTQLGIYRGMPGSGKQERYASPLPDLAPCIAAPPGSLCSPTAADLPPLPNDLAFDDAGHAYVTDAMQATIWRVPAGGGDPVVWFQHTRLASEYIGVNGIRLDPSRTRLYVTVSSDLTGRSFVYTLPLVARPAAADLAVFHEYDAGDLPDGIAFGASGLLYVAMATPTRSGVSVLSPDGRERFRFTNPSPVATAPFDSPANIAFDGKGAILLSNHAFATGVANPTQFSVVDVWVGDVGSPLVLPKLR